MIRTCSRCSTPDLEAACPVCTEEWVNRRDADKMTPEERLAEFRSWSGILEIDFAKVHQRIQELGFNTFCAGTLGGGGARS